MILECIDIVKIFEQPAGEGHLTVLDGVSLEVESGDSLAVIGPSGSGKSTLLNIIGTLDLPTSGTIRIDGRNPADMDDRTLSRFRNLEIGFVFQLHHLLPQCTVLENVLLPTIPTRAKGSANETNRRAEHLLERVGLGERVNYFPAQLSGGELQRTAVVRALINRPRLLLADEPTGSLDRDSAEGLGELLVQLNREEETTLIIVTHSSELSRRMNHISTLRNGRLEKTR
ncbi:MAG: ABC transporter ATP-binding protein [Candidatus Aminicenantes bacterium]|nr:ABC transporter ATP-binding protein [Candidatus Aminicenantes bacterium]